MSAVSENLLQQKISELEKENAMLRRDFSYKPEGNTVSVPPEMRPLFDVAEETVNEYFRQLKMDPTNGTIEINDQRYVLVRASALSKDFLETVQSLYADRGESEAMAIGKNFLFDIAHVIGMNDARNFHTKMNLTDPIAKLSAGTVHFAYSGWAYVDILPESNPSLDENFYLFYNHPYSFEADSWKRAGKKADTAICIMNAGYSSGWCEESFGQPLTAVEVSCTAKGDDQCTFIMSPPHKIQEHLDKFHSTTKNRFNKSTQYEVPTFFDRKRVEEEMQRSKILADQSAKSKSDFIANISHELRTPLGAILGFTDLLKKTNLTDQQQDYVQAVGSAGNSLLAIINDVLDLSKIDAGKFIIDRIPFSIHELVHSVQVMFAAKAQEKGIEFKCHVDDQIVHVLEGDPMRLTQVLINLIGNAIKFTQQGGVYVECQLQEEKEECIDVIFTVKDTGIGIEEAKAQNIFERFTQADTNITRKYGGTGLGLAITRQLIELQGGNISLVSEEGNGATFIFTISYHKNFGQDFIPTLHNPATGDLLKEVRNVLVVEDNLMNQKLATIILQNNGFKIVVAENGNVAIDILSNQHFDMILMDIQMPAMDGYEATAIIRNKLKVTTPIIAMTAHALSGEKEKCLRVGMNEYISKPYKEGELMAKMMTVKQQEKEGSRLGYVDENIVDLSFLKNQTKNNSPFIKEMMEIFLLQHPQDIATLRQAIEQTNYVAIYKTAHSIRNSISFFGLEKLMGKALLQIENFGKEEKQIELIEQLFLSITPVSEQALQQLELLNNSMQS